MKTQTFTAEVLVVGGGGAGLVAALEARRTGAEVLLLDKSSSGKSSSTSLSFGAFRVANTAASREEHFAQTVAAGKSLNDQKLLRILVDQAFDRVRGLTDYGVPLLHEDPYYYVTGEAPFYGLQMTVPLQRAAHSGGILSWHHTVALDLLKIDDTIRGVMAYDFSQDTFLIISARATILATGGAGALYPFHDNSPRTTGDGFALAARAGAVLRDMEFVQFYPLGLMEAGSFRCIVPPFLTDSAPIRNAAGEDLLAKYRIAERPAAVKARDALCQAMFREISAGRGFGPYLEIDLRRVPQEEWDQDRQLSHYQRILQEKYRGLERPLKIAPVCHHFMGGVAADEAGRTNLPGLFAVGEVTGGLHGANRMGGNALSECVVFGALVGREAAQYARRTGADSVEKGITRKGEEQILLWRERARRSFQSPPEFKKRLAEIMFAKAGIIRTGAQLEEARSEVESLAKEAQTSTGCQTPKDILQAIEVIHLIKTSRLVLHGALRRTESRGSHYREDYPEADDRRWLVHLIREGGMA